MDNSVNNHDAMSRILSSLQTSRTLLELLRKRLAENDEIGQEIVSNLHIQSDGIEDDVLDLLARSSSSPSAGKVAWRDLARSITTPSLETENETDETVSSSSSTLMTVEAFLADDEEDKVLSASRRPFPSFFQFTDEQGRNSTIPLETPPPREDEEEFLRASPSSMKVYTISSSPVRAEEKPRAVVEKVAEDLWGPDKEETRIHFHRD